MKYRIIISFIFITLSLSASNSSGGLFMAKDWRWDNAAYTCERTGKVMRQRQKCERWDYSNERCEYYANRTVPVNGCVRWGCSPGYRNVGTGCLLNADAGAKVEADRIAREQKRLEALKSESDCEAGDAAACMKIVGSHWWYYPTLSISAEAAEAENKANAPIHWRYINRACDLGSHWACERLHFVYSDIDLHKANYKIQQALATQNLAKIAEPDFAPDAEKSAAFLKLACEHGLGDFSNPYMGFSNTDPRCNPLEDTLAEACDRGDGESCYRRAMVYQITRVWVQSGTFENERRFRRGMPLFWESISKACDLNYAQACIHVAAFHLNSNRLNKPIEPAPEVGPVPRQKWYQIYGREYILPSPDWDENRAQDYLRKACVDLDFSGENAEFACQAFR